MSFTDKLAKKYANTFSLPSRQILVVELFVLGAVVGVISYTLTLGLKGSLFGLMDGLISLALGSLISVIIIARVTKGGMLTFSRLIAVADFSLIFLAIGLIAAAAISNIASNPAILENTYFVSCGILVAFSFIVLSITSNFNKLELFILSIFQFIVILLLHTILIYSIFNISFNLISIYFISFFLMAILAYLLGMWYYSSIGKAGKQLLGYSGVILFKAFLDALVLDKTGLIEQLLKILAVRGNIEVSNIYFENSSQNGIIVAPLIHPGPFRDLGSSKLPTRIASAFLSKNVFPIVFHTPTTHDKDLVIAGDCDRVVQMLTELELKSERGISKPFIVKKKGNITISCQIFNNIPLVVISRSPIPTEDLPDNINTLCMEKIREKGYSDGIVVDAHNVMDKPYSELSQDDIENMLSALDEALEEAQNTKGDVLLAGLSNVKLANYSAKDGIGDAGIMALVTEVNGTKAAFISIDANNMVVGLREKIQNALKNMGYINSEITTTDTHIVTGRSAGEGYFPLGKAIPEDILIERILEAVISADSKKAECSVKYSKRKLEDVYLLGNKGLENLWKVTDESLRVAKRGLIVLILLLLISGTIIITLV